MYERNCNEVQGGGRASLLHEAFLIEEKIGTDLSSRLLGSILHLEYALQLSLRPLRTFLDSHLTQTSSPLDFRLSPLLSIAFLSIFSSCSQLPPTRACDLTQHQHKHRQPPTLAAYPRRTQHPPPSSPPHRPLPPLPSISHSSSRSTHHGPLRLR